MESSNFPQVVATRLIDNAGRIQLPPEFRDAMGWHEATAIDISLAGEGRIMLQKHLRSCSLCGSVVNLIPFENIHICYNCMNKIYEYNKKALLK